MKTKLLNKCINLSRQMIDCPDGRSKHFSFLILKNRIVGIGYNLSFTTDPLANKYGYRFNAIHSELKAIKEFIYPPGFLSRCSIINVRILKDNTIGMSKPCQRCQRLLSDFGITEIYYTNRQGDFEYVTN